VKLLLDMNIPPRWVGFFQAQGLVASHWSDVGDPRAPDHEIMGRAEDNDYIVFTHDLDFGALLAATDAQSPSVIQIRADDTTPEAFGQTLVDSLRRYQSELQAGALIVIEPGRARVRILPLR
jgi:predicted nuclease of predicted toxin-antitoxin system